MKWYFFKKIRLSALGGIVFLSLQALFLLSCAATKPMNMEAINKYKILNNPEMFKVYQYFVSRDVVLSFEGESEPETNIIGGQAFITTKTESDTIQLLGSTAGLCLDYKVEGGILKLGIEFEEESGNLLWFYHEQRGGEDFFYFDYTDPITGKVMYGDRLYTVSYEDATGAKASFQRMGTSKKTDKGEINYQAMEPVLLYEEKATEERKETKRTLGGSRIKK
jgi:hypothetical protein